VVPVLIALFVGVFALRERTSFVSLVVVASASFGLYALWVGLAMTALMKSLAALGVGGSVLVLLAPWLMWVTVIIASGAAVGWFVRLRIPARRSRDMASKGIEQSARR